ncbi:MAG: hypothetical protein ACOYXB_01905 [Bacteroidota bacterium]
MKKFLRKFFLFIPFFLAFYVVLVIIMDELEFSKLDDKSIYPIASYGHLQTRLKEVKETSDVDILFIGSSHTYRGFDTRIFLEAGYKSFNLGSSAQTPIETLVLLKRYLKKLNPKLVILETFPDVFESDGVESSLDLIANDKNDLNSLSMALKVNSRMTYNALIFGWFRNITGLNETMEEPLIRGNDTYVSGGFVSRKPETFVTHEHYPPKSFHFSRKQIRSFEKIIRILQKEERKYIIVQLPITSDLYHSYSNAASFDSLVSSYGTYINYNGIVDLSDSLDFFDNNHLNQNGVSIFDREVLREIETMGLIRK